MSRSTSPFSASEAECSSSSSSGSGSAESWDVDSACNPSTELISSSPRSDFFEGAIDGSEHPESDEYPDAGGFPDTKEDLDTNQLDIEDLAGSQGSEDDTGLQAAETRNGSPECIPQYGNGWESAVEQTDCGGCYEPPTKTRLVLLDCGCLRCRPCLNKNIRVGLTSKYNYPPTCCCKVIEIQYFRDLLKPDVLERYKAVQDEFSSKRPVYCAAATRTSRVCGIFLPEGSYEDDWVTCPSCDEVTCVQCRNLRSNHIKGSNACPDGLKTEERRMMEQLGCSPCPRCRQMIEKTKGCNHIRCECGQNFCYRCQEPTTKDMRCKCVNEMADPWSELVQESKND